VPAAAHCRGPLADLLTRHCLKRQVAPCTRRIATRRKGQRAGRGIRYPPVCNLVDAALVAQKTVHKLTAAGNAKRQRLLLVFAIEVSDLDAEKQRGSTERMAEEMAPSVCLSYRARSRQREPAFICFVLTQHSASPTRILVPILLKETATGSFERRNSALFATRRFLML
jgi:hypothetical protein